MGKWLGLILIVTVLGGCGIPPQAGGVLVDSIHAHNALQLAPGDDPFAYHNVYGMRIAFDYLRSRHMAVEEVKEGKLTPERLAGHSVLFINLVSADLPMFGAGEIRAIRAFVEKGGGLFLITDHTNCYYHLSKLEPLLDELDIRMTPETACEFPPHNLGGLPGGWIAIDHFVPHPVTSGLRTIAFQSGGTVDERFAVALTSDRAWGDLTAMHPYGEGDTPGFYGNFKPDPGERTGELGVVLAKTLGRGRIVIVADQNIFGDPFVNYADNDGLFLNAMAWLGRRSDLADERAYIQSRGPAVLCYERFDRPAFGDPSAQGYYRAYVQLGRAFPVFARPDLSGDWGVIVFADANYRLSGKEMNLVLRHLAAGKSVVILNGSAPVGEDGGLLDQLAARLGPSRSRQQGKLLVFEWPEAGRVIVVLESDVTMKLPAPEKKPDALDEARIGVMVGAVRMAISGQPMPIDGSQP